MPFQKTEQELFEPGDTAPIHGVYELVDEQGSLSDHDTVLLDQGDIFPEVLETGLYWRLRYTPRGRRPI